MLELSGSGDAWRMGHAGDTFNTLWTLRALLPGATCDYVSAFGDDPFSQSQLDFFAASGIGTAASPRIPGARPGLYAITLSGAERSFTYWRADSAARRLADDGSALARSLAARTLVYFSGITLAILAPEARHTLLRAIDAARAKGAKVAFDPNYRPRLWADAAQARAATEAVLPLCDIVLPTFPDEQTLFGDRDPLATVARIAAAGVPEIAVKNGDSPTTLGLNGTTEVIPVQPVADAVDTTGAGDSFNGAYLASRLSGLTSANAVGRAHSVAGTVIRVRGALASPPALRGAFAAD